MLVSAKNEELGLYFEDDKEDLEDVASHHGILGMKWGIRRTPEQLGHTTPSSNDNSPIKAHTNPSVSDDPSIINHLDPSHPSIPVGTIFHRVSVNKSDMDSNGPIYVTYGDDYDRHFYKSSALQTLRDWSNAKDMYEQEFKNVKTLKVASYKQVQDIAERLYEEDQEFKKTVAKAYVDKKIREDYDIKNAEEFVKGALYKDRAEQRVKEMLRDAEEDKNLYLLDFGATPANKKKVIDELKSKGYNSMTDCAGVGSPLNENGKGREGQDPLIVFDTSVFTQPKSHVITNAESEKNTSYTSSKMKRR